MNLDERKKLLDSTLKDFGVEGILHPGGKIYQAALEAMDLASVWKSVEVLAEFTGIEKGGYEVGELPVFLDQSIQGKIIASNEVGKSRIKKFKSLEYETLIAKKPKANRAEGFNPPHRGHGSVTGNLFEFCKFMNGATYTEMNMYYQGKTPETYNSYRDRGGSFAHHFESLREPRKRLYNGKETYLEKRAGKWFTVND